MLLILVSGFGFAQTPEKMTYQAIVRNAKGDLVSDTNVGVRISILKGSVTGTVSYSETHRPTTNANGLFTIEIGSGTVVSGTFESIDWGSDTFFIKSETDRFGGTDYSIVGTNQLLSVPYALHAKKAANVPSYKIGDFAHGGVVFWVDETGQHGLVCAKEDQNSGIRWFAGTFGVTNAKSNGIYAGKSNTSISITTHGIIGDDTNDYAAKICNELEVVENTILYGDWYLPSVFELKLISQNLATINATAIANGGQVFINNFYWSSTEDTDNNAKIVNVSNAQENSVFKSSQNPVRAIRSF